jgi:hypothetical protein
MTYWYKLEADCTQNSKDWIDRELLGKAVMYIG